MFALREADLSTHTERKQQMEMLTELRHRVQRQLDSKAVIRRKDLAMDGFAVMAETGLSPGPEVGKILKVLHERVLDHPDWNNREALTDLLRQIQIRKVC